MVESAGRCALNLLSLSYLLFIPLVWVLTRLVNSVTARPMKARQLLWLAASYLFYATWSLKFLCVLVVSSLVNYALGIYLKRKPTAGRLWVGIGFNLLMLAVFKYLPVWSSHLGQGHHSWLLENVILPVGVSFWTFEALSYLFDIYREEDLDPSLTEFCLYMAFWPTVLSGPVCRMPELLPQFRNPQPTGDDIADGVRRIVLGLFMKTVLSQILGSGLRPGEGVDFGFNQMARGWTGLDVWILAIGFAFQMYFDFAGYSNIVIGTARVFGITLRENFRDPFLSTSPAEFWTRWHMSLSSWIRDYVFMPLATWRPQVWWRHASLVIAMMLFGFWHGADWTYIVWGALQGLLLVSHRQFQQFERRSNLQLPPIVSSLGGWAITFCAMLLSWVVFRAIDLHQARLMFHALVHFSSYRHFVLPRNFVLMTVVIAVSYFVIAGLRRLAENMKQSPVVLRIGWALSPVMYSVAVLAIVIMSIHKAVFVYLQF
jgi:D-alanyl-lipoteichoic acid acyltransferase DltB (MBOAT superfamily)